MKTRKKKIAYSGNQVDIPYMEVIQNNLFNMSHPVESIFETTNSSCNTPENLVNYFKTLFGVTSAGTWERFGEGKVIVGYQSSDNDFKTVGGTGGSKYVQSHYHTWSNTHNHSDNFSLTSGDGVTNNTSLEGSHSHAYRNNWGSASSGECIRTETGDGNIISGGIFDNGSHRHNVYITGSVQNSTISGDTSSYGAGNAGNLQPYIVVYRYRRIN